jgi:MFS family permease
MKRLHWHDFISINLFWFGMNIRNTAVGSVFMPYLVAGFVPPEIKNTALGAMRVAGLMVAMLVQPAAGLLSDRSRSRFGRRRPFIFIGVMFDIVFLSAIGLVGSYWALFVVLLFQQFSANVSHGPLQGLIPDLVPEDQRGRASAVKSIFELLPIVLVPFLIAGLVAAGQVGLAIAATSALLLITMLLTVIFVREEPLREALTGSIKGPMLRVVGMLAGIYYGAEAGFLAGGLLGGLVGLVAWPLAGPKVAQMIAFGVGGLIAMLIAVGVGVWSGALATLAGAARGIILGAAAGVAAGGLIGVLAWLVGWPLIEAAIAGLLVAMFVSIGVGFYIMIPALPALRSDARQHASFIWWIVNRLLFLAAATSIQGFAPYFLMSAFGVDRGEGIQMTANLFLVVGIFTVVIALPGGWLADQVGSKMLTRLAGIIATLGTLVLLSTTLAPNLPLMYVAGSIIGMAVGLFMTANWALGTGLAPRQEAGRFLGVSNLAGAGAGMIGAGIGGLLADALNRLQPGMGYFAIFTCYGVLFLSSTIILIKVRGEKLENPAGILSTNTRSS